MPVATAGVESLVPETARLLSGTTRNVGARTVPAGSDAVTPPMIERRSMTRPPAACTARAAPATSPVSDVTTTRVAGAELAGTAATPVAASARASSAAVREIACVGVRGIDFVRPFPRRARLVLP